MSNTKNGPRASGGLPSADHDDPAMTGAEFRCLREWLALPATWLAEQLDVAERTIHRWENGVSAIPHGVAEAILALSEQTYDLLNSAVDSAMDAPEPRILTYRTDADMRAAQPGSDWPASWHRALCARVADEVPGLRIDYWTAGQ